MGQGLISPIGTTQVSRIAKLRRRAASAARSLIPSDPCDVATCLLLAAVAAVALLTFRDYAISNDEGVQHHYGELIIAYYTSGFADQRVFNFQNLYLYGGLFDVVSIILGHLIPLDPYDLRHILCALIGIEQLKNFERAASTRRRAVARMRGGLSKLPGLTVASAPHDQEPIWLYLPVFVEEGEFSGRLSQLELERIRRGPLIIKQRARAIGAELTIESRPGQGARLEIRLPQAVPVSVA